MRAPALLLLACLFLSPLSGCLGPDARTASGQGATAWSFTDTEGQAQPQATPPGNATVLFFMATWCGTCRSKAPALAAVHEDYAEKGVRFYSVGFDPTETPEQLRAWKEERAQPWPHGLDEGLRLQRAFGVTSQSSVVLLDASGNVAKGWGYGGVTEASLRAALDEALARAPAPASPPGA